MALLGTLKGFGVTDIFQLISQQMKTGSLVLTSPKAKVTIAFQDGVIEGINSDHWEMDPRAEILLQGGYIQEKDFKTAIENQKKNASSWFEILISQGQLKQLFLDKATEVIIKKILLEVFQWREGSYRFEDWDLETENMLPCYIQTESIILNTLRIIDEWPVIKPKIPPADYCPVTIMPITDDLRKKFELSEEDIRIFDLIDERKTIEMIVRESLETPFDVLSGFVKLIDAGLVEVFPKGSKEKRDLSIAKNVFIFKLKIASVFVVLGLCILALIAFGQPRISHPKALYATIQSQLENQKEVADSFTRRGIKLSELNRDRYAR
ncbi:MAG: DUF4388 domain-containing protein [Deltaproteobacteria bacterium]|nr:DUF4388 domain-containing protein [Deltaproteobacteria bacterium]